MGLTAIAYVSGKDIFKGLVMGSIGLLLATVGMDPITAVPRFVFNVPELIGGIELIGVLIGLFSVSEVLRQAFKQADKVEIIDISKEKYRGSWHDIIPLRMTVFKSTIIGAVIGAYSLTNSVYPVIVALIVGIFGFIFQKHGYSPAPLLIGLILGRLVENSLRQALIISEGSWMIFLQRPIPAFTTNAV